VKSRWGSACFFPVGVGKGAKIPCFEGEAFDGTAGRRWRVGRGSGEDREFVWEKAQSVLSRGVAVAITTNKTTLLNAAPLL
jgi:hypothetical protein